MFGFLTPGAPTLEYRQAYAQCCAYQHSWYGVSSLAFLSYEAVFLYLCAVDAGLSEGPPAGAPCCCRLRSSRLTSQTPDAAVTQFCASLGLLLASIKLEDDVRDERSWLARGARGWLRRRLEAARAYFAAQDVHFMDRISHYLHAHEELERGREPIALQDYAKPTADAFGYVFGLLAQISGAPCTGDILTMMGRKVGAAMIAFDAAVDFPSDRRFGRYNPLPTAAAVGPTLSWAALQLSAAGWLCVDSWGIDAQAARVLRASFDRVVARQNACESVPWNPRHAPWLRRVRRAALARAGFCDCDCPCDCPGCDCDHVPGCDCCICDPCLDPCCRTRHEKIAAASEATDAAADPQQGGSLVGMTGRTTSQLSPSGIVEVGSKHLPAQSEGEWIDAGVEVLVVKQSRFGLIVRPNISL